MDGFQPDRKPQQMARMLAAQERNSSLNVAGNNMRNVPQPNMMYSGATPNVNPGIPPQAMNFNGPMQARQGGIPLGYGPPQGGMGMRGYGPPQGGMPLGPRAQMAPQIGGMMQPRGAGARGYPSSPGMTTPQGGAYRGDFENAS
jgi:hypothetical protein